MSCTKSAVLHPVVRPHRQSDVVAGLLQTVETFLLYQRPEQLVGDLGAKIESGGCLPALGPGRPKD